MRRLRLIVAGAVLGLIVGIGVVIIRSPDYESQAQIIVQDPRASSLFDALGFDEPSTQSSERFVADQVEILRSRFLVDEVRQELGYETLEQVYRRTTITGDLTSNLIEVVFAEDSPEKAQEGAAAFVDAYEDLVARQTQQTAEAALVQADALIAGFDDLIDELQQEITESALQDATRQELAAVQADLAAARSQRDAAALGSPERAALNLRVGELITDLGALQQLVVIPDPTSTTDSLILERDDAVRARSDLISTRNAIAVGAEASTGRIVLDSPASFPEEPVGPTWWMIIAGFALLGAVIAAVAAYSTEMRNRRIMTNAEAGWLVDLQSLGEVPRLRSAKSLGGWMIGEDPYSIEAEAFRLTASTVAISAKRSDASVLALVSSSVGAGKTTVAANLALACAEQGNRVLLVDADFATHDLTKVFLASGMLVEDVRFEPGHDRGQNAVLELWEGDGALSESDGSLAFVSLDAAPDKVTSFLRSAAMEELFSWARKHFDLVLVDGPPPMSIAYASSLVQLSDLSVMVIEHANTLSSVEELSGRLAFLDRPALGYIYTKAPVHGIDNFEGSLSVLSPPDAEPHRRLFGREPD